MVNNRFYMLGHTAALSVAAQQLEALGISFTPSPDDAVTHLLLPVPAFAPDGSVKGGGNLQAALAELPKTVCVIGGNLDHPALSGYQTVDLLKDPFYVTQNAQITAHCAIRLAMQQLPVTFDKLPTLVIGWGRIGKCLARLLKDLGADVTVACRKDTDRAMLQALGYRAVSTQALSGKPYRVIFNTAPEMVLPYSPDGILKIDLASRPGIGGTDVLQARGLPGKDAPESSGMLIAQTIARLRKEKLL